MNEHPRPWMCRVSPGSVIQWNIWDANDLWVGGVNTEATARLIVDLANAAELQQRLKWTPQQAANGWILDEPELRPFIESGELTTYQPTPHETILAAAAWLQAREAKGGS